MGQDNRSLKRLKTGRVERAFSMARMSLTAGAKAIGYVAHTALAGKDEARLAGFLTSQAELLTAELSKLKGSLMKAGQMLSMIGEHFFPPEVNQILKKLQSQSEPVAYDVMEKVLKRQLDAELLARLSIDPTPYASASVGQVHRARIDASGEELCLKIQYPGMDKAIESDVGTLKSLLSLSRLLPRGVDFEPIFAEVRQMLRQELDYKRELEETIAFKELLAQDPRFRVPEVFREFSSNRVLATGFEPGLGIDSPEVKALSLTRRNRLGTMLLELFCRELFVYGKVQTDPHFGNYRVRIDEQEGLDQLILLDFGAVRKFPLSFVANYKKLIKSALVNERGACEQAGEALGILVESDGERPRQVFYEFCRLILEPYLLPEEREEPCPYVDSTGLYDWGTSDLAKRVGKKATEMIFAFTMRSPPRELIFLDRKITGVFIALTVLGPIFRARDLLEVYLKDS